MRLPNLSCATLMLLALSACAAPRRQRLFVVQAVSYAIPPVQADGSRNVASDDSSELDTPETVSEAQPHKARYDAVC